MNASNHLLESICGIKSFKKRTVWGSSSFPLSRISQLICQKFVAWHSFTIASVITAHLSSPPFRKINKFCAYQPITSLWKVSPWQSHLDILHPLGEHLESVSISLIWTLKFSAPLKKNKSFAEVGCSGRHEIFLSGDRHLTLPGSSFPSSLKDGGAIRSPSMEWAVSHYFWGVNSAYLSRRWKASAKTLPFECLSQKIGPPCHELIL